MDFVSHDKGEQSGPEKPASKLGNWKRQQRGSSPGPDAPSRVRQTETAVATQAGSCVPGHASTSVPPHLAPRVQGLSCCWTDSGPFQTRRKWAELHHAETPTLLESDRATVASAGPRLQQQQSWGWSLEVGMCGCPIKQRPPSCHGTPGAGGCPHHWTHPRAPLRFTCRWRDASEGALRMLVCDANSRQHAS